MQVPRLALRADVAMKRYFTWTLRTYGSRKKVREQVVEIVNIASAEDPADMLTEYVDRATLEIMLSKSSMRRLEGRSPAAQELPPDDSKDK